MRPGDVLLHQVRDSWGRVHVERWAVVQVRAGVALCRRGGESRRFPVEAAAHPSFAVQPQLGGEL